LKITFWYCNIVRVVHGWKPVALDVTRTYGITLKEYSVARSNAGVQFQKLELFAEILTAAFLD
jgi:hypothetical protein